jgi:hypothetical protein
MPKMTLRIELLENRYVPATITPTTFDDGGFGSGSLRDAVLHFNADTGTDDDIIQLLPGTYRLTIRNTHGHESAGLEGDLNLTQTSHRWIIQGAGPSTVIDASQLQDRVFQIVNPGSQVVFRDLVIQGGLAQDNGADGVQAGTTDSLGGGILNNGGEVRLDNVVVQNNMAQGGDVTALRVAGHSALGGGLYSSGGALTLAGATIANNEATGGRGGDSSLTRYVAGAGGSAAGAGLYASGGSLDISDSRIANNRATGGRGGDGGYYTSTYTFSGYTYYRRYGLGGQGGGAQGGGLYVNRGSLTVSSSTIASNQGAGGPGGVNGGVGFSEGGGLYNSSNTGTPTVTGSTLSDNSATYGGGIDNEYGGALTVSNSTLSGNSAADDGGGIDNAYGGVLTVSNSTLFGNSASYGGGIDNNSGSLTVSNSTLSGNSAYGGGGIDNLGGTLTVSNSTLSGNSANNGDGGGIFNGYNYYFGTVTVSNSTLSGNSAAYFGGGISTASPRPVTLTNVSVTANRANTSGGGLYVYIYGRGPVLHNTLIAGNFRDATGMNRDDVYGSLDPSDNNLIGDGTGMTGLRNGVNGNLVGSTDNPIDPLLGPLDENGGPTRTHALLSGSPAIDAGNNAYATDWDQRGPGYPRIVNGIIDIGAFEVQAAGPAPRDHSLVQRLFPIGRSLDPPMSAPINTVLPFDEPQLGPLPAQPLVEAPTRWHVDPGANSIPPIVQRVTDAVFAAATLEAQWGELLLWLF